MTIPRTLPAGLGALAIVPTTAILVIHMILAAAGPTTAVRATAAVAVALEVVVLCAISSLTLSYFGSWPWLARAKNLSGACFGVGVLVCTLSAAISVASLVSLSNAASDSPSTILGSRATNLLVGSSVALGLAFAVQLIFLVFHFVASRFDLHSGKKPDVEENRPQTSHRGVKSIGYHQTSPYRSKAYGSVSSTRSPPGSSYGRSPSETMLSIRSSLSNIVNPISSKTQLLPAGKRSSQRPTSTDSGHANEKRPIVSEDTFDSWDTSAVDPQNRQTVLQTSPTTSALARFLETIPASPSTSRSPSPGEPFDLEPPPIPPMSRQRSRSFSPAPGSVRSQRSQRTISPQTTPTRSESHIHPLFRTDSPTPPPFATPGTVVTAAPNGGQLISDKASIRTLTRMRSGSLPAVPSPLSRQGSFDSFHRRPTTSAAPELREEDEMEWVDGTERKMTPPIPDWILSAGSRLSMSGYNSRKGRSSEALDSTGSPRGWGR